MSIKNWEKEFVNEFCDPNDTDLINEYEESWRIKNFISNLLTQQRTEILEGILNLECLNKEFPIGNTDRCRENNARNKLRNEIKEAIEKL